MKEILSLGYVFGHTLNRDMQRRLAKVILTATWTKQELAYAAAYIPTSIELAETITYNRTINPVVFAKAKETDFVKRGRLFEYPEALAFSGEKGEPIHTLFETALLGEKTVFYLR